MISNERPSPYGRGNGNSWHHSPPSGTIVVNQYYAPASSPDGLSTAILGNADFKNLIISTLDAQKLAVQIYFSLHPEVLVHTFSIPMGDEVNFQTGDLHNAIGHGHLQNCILSATVTNSIDFPLLQLDIQGTLFDLFDFDVTVVDTLNLNRRAAEVQAGYNPSEDLTSGQVFYTQVTLDQTHLPISYNFGP
jgi:hypothetical protein